MSEWKVHSALVDSFLDLMDVMGIPYTHVAIEQREFTPPADASMWYALSNLPGGRDPRTLGQYGDDEYAGVFQIDVSGQQGQGVRPVLEAAGALTAHYTAGKSFTKDGQAVRIRKSELSTPRRDGVRLVSSVSVYWSAAIPR